jgi:hypothetical protein
MAFDVVGVKGPGTWERACPTCGQRWKITKEKTDDDD